MNAIKYWEELKISCLKKEIRPELGRIKRTKNRCPHSLFSKTIISGYEIIWKHRKSKCICSMEFLQILITYSSKCNYFMQKALAIQMIHVALFIVGKNYRYFYQYYCINSACQPLTICIPYLGFLPYSSCHLDLPFT